MSEAEKKKAVVPGLGSDETENDPQGDNEKSIHLLQWYLKLALDGEGEDEKKQESSEGMSDETA